MKRGWRKVLSAEPWRIRPTDTYTRYEGCPCGDDCRPIFTVMLVGGPV